MSASNDVLELRIDNLAKEITKLTATIKEVDDRSRTLELYITRWKGASAALLGIGALLAWVAEKAVAFFPTH